MDFEWSTQSRITAWTLLPNILLLTKHSQTDYLQALKPARAQLETANYNETSHMPAMLFVLAYSTCITVSVWCIAMFWCFSYFSAVVAVCSAEGKCSGTFRPSFQSSQPAEDHTLAWTALFPMGCSHHSQKFGQTTGLKKMVQTLRRRRRRSRGW